MPLRLPRMLFELRSERKLSQAEVAKRIGVSQPSLSYYENGKRNCSIPILKKLAEFYGVSCDILLSIAPEASDNSTYQLSAAEKQNEFYHKCEKVILSYVKRIGDKELQETIKDWFALFYYKLFRTIFEMNEENSNHFFSLDDTYERELFMKILETDKTLNSIAKRKSKSAPKITISSLTQEYPNDYKSFIALIAHAEDLLLDENDS